MAKLKIDKSFESRIENELNEIGLSLVEFRKFQAGQASTIRITICDPKKPVGHDQCTQVSRLIHSIEPELKESYNLEIWSPGVERELKTDREFLVFKGQAVLLSLKENEKQELTGTLVKKNNDSVNLLIDGQEKSFKSDQIKTIKLAPQKPESQEPIEISLEDI